MDEDRTQIEPPEADENAEREGAASERPEKSGGAMLWAIGWLAVALAMVIWPRPPWPVDYSCVHDEDAFIFCFVSTSWGNPLGVGLSLFFSAVAFRRFWSSGSTTKG